MKTWISISMVAAGLATNGCASTVDDQSASRTEQDETEQAVDSERTAYLGDHVSHFTLTRSTGYYHANTTMQGGYTDRLGKKLQTLEDYLDGRAEYVSVAMDLRAFPYGQKLRIPYLEETRNGGKHIDFRVVDTGGAFRDKRLTRMDICTESAEAARRVTIPRLEVEVVR